MTSIEQEHSIYKKCTPVSDGIVNKKFCQILFIITHRLNYCFSVQPAEYFSELKTYELKTSKYVIRTSNFVVLSLQAN